MTKVVVWSRLSVTPWSASSGCWRRTSSISASGESAMAATLIAVSSSTRPADTRVSTKATSTPSGRRSGTGTGGSAGQVPCCTRRRGRRRRPATRPTSADGTRGRSARGRRGPVGASAARRPRAHRPGARRRRPDGRLRGVGGRRTVRGGLAPEPLARRREPQQPDGDRDDRGHEAPGHDPGDEERHGEHRQPDPGGAVAQQGVDAEHRRDGRAHAGDGGDDAQRPAASPRPSGPCRCRARRPGTPRSRRATRSPAGRSSTPTP